MRFLPLAIAVLTAVSACEPERPPPSVGTPDQLRYAPAGTIFVSQNNANGTFSETRLTTLEAEGVRGRYSLDGREGSFYPGCWACGGAMAIDEAALRALWPLGTGNEARFDRTGPDGSVALIIIRVAGLETITTPAGTFQAYVLDGRLEQDTDPRYTAQIRAWWAPSVGWVVRAEGGDSRGNTLSTTVTEIISP